LRLYNINVAVTGALARELFVPVDKVVAAFLKFKMTHYL
jgi:hypothetical protein